MDASTLVALFIPTLMAAIYGALKYYSKTIGPSPEQFNINKFVPFLVLGLLVGFFNVYTSGTALTEDQIIMYMEQSTGMLVLIETILQILARSKGTTANS